MYEWFNIFMKLNSSSHHTYGSCLKSIRKREQYTGESKTIDLNTSTSNLHENLINITEASIVETEIQP